MAVAPLAPGLVLPPGPLPLAASLLLGLLDGWRLGRRVDEARDSRLSAGQQRPWG